MENLTISRLQANTRITTFLLVRYAERRTDKNGNSYLDMNLADKTGEINCKKWDGDTPVPAAGSVVKVQATVQDYNGRLQMRIEKIREATEDDPYDLSQLVAAAPEKPEVMNREILDTVEKFKDEDLKKLVLEMLRIAGDRLMYFPAAQRMHHAERSGLLHHTTGMLRTAEKMLECYPFLHGDLLRAGVILHDLAKIDEMKSDELGNVTDYTRDGLLIGHLVRGVATLHQAAEHVGVKGEKVALLEHMIISHHGIAEYGSPRKPMFPEAEVLHWLDILDARMNEMQGIMERTPAGSFSENIKSLERRIYHPMYEMDAE
ncbi:MAG: HD domain-containing protein [Clostridia bacterium]|nr:HD domain-containing protein [Clostridia bacterium]